MGPLISRILILLTGLFALSSQAAAAPTPAPSPSPAAESSALYEPRVLDGVTIEAVETHPNPSDSSVGLGVGLYPFNGFYSALLLNGSYLHRINRKYQWEILNASYSYTFDKDLTNELADRFNVNPRVIDRLDFMVSTNIIRVLSHGKFIFMEDHIRYFQAAGILGMGLVKTNQNSNFAPNFGLRVEVFTSEKFSWRLDIRDALTIGDFDHFVSFTIGTGYGF